MIKTPWLFFLSFIIGAIAVGFAVERLIFISSAQKTIGQVIGLESYNDRCGGGRRRRSYACTKFTANIQFFDRQGSRYEFQSSAGSSRGSNRSIDNADYSVGVGVEVIYNPKNPKKVYVNTIFGVWGIPIVLFFTQIGALISSFFSKHS